MLAQFEPTEFRAQPLGRCVVGPTSVVWCEAPDLIGSIHWGALDEPSVRDLVALLEFVRHPDLASSGTVLMDCSGVEQVDGDVLLDLTRLAPSPPPAGPPTGARHAVVVPRGITGLLLAGALTSLVPRHALRIVRDVETAFAVLGYGAPPRTYGAAMSLAATARATPPLIARLRDQLSCDLIDATVQQSATALSLSVRTLQRELRRHGTTFSDELRRVRVAAAYELLRHSRSKVDAIASRVGLGTGSRLSAMLRRELNLIPSEVRAGAQLARES